MGIEVIHSETLKAKKEYRDDGWEWFNEWIGYGCYTGKQKLTFAEGRIIINHRNRLKPYLIQKGDVYERQRNKYEGAIYTWRMNADLFKMACKYDIFPEV